MTSESVADTFPTQRIVATYRVEMNQPLQTARPMTMMFVLEHTKGRRFI